MMGHIKDVSPESHGWPDTWRAVHTSGTVVRQIQYHWLARGKGGWDEAAAGAERAPSAKATIVEQRRRDWLSDRGEPKISYKLGYAAVASGGIPVELMHGVSKQVGNGVCPRLLMGYDVPMPPERRPSPLDGYDCDREAGSGILGLDRLENGERPSPVRGGG